MFSHTFDTLATPSHTNLPHYIAGLVCFRPQPEHCQRWIFTPALNLSPAFVNFLLPQFLHFILDPLFFYALRADPVCWLRACEPRLCAQALSAPGADYVYGEYFLEALREAVLTVVLVAYVRLVRPLELIPATFKAFICWLCHCGTHASLSPDV